MLSSKKPLLSVKAIFPGLESPITFAWMRLTREKRLQKLCFTQQSTQLNYSAATLHLEGGSISLLLPPHHAPDRAHIPGLTHQSELPACAKLTNPCTYYLAQRACKKLWRGASYLVIAMPQLDYWCSPISIPKMSL